MLINILLDGEVPSKKNSRINTRSGRSFPNRKYTQWHDTQLLLLDKTKKITDEQVEIQMDFTHGTLRRRDSDNAVSSVLDLLVDAGILPDDNWKVVKRLVINNFYKKNKPRCSIQIRTLNA